MIGCLIISHLRVQQVFGKLQGNAVESTRYGVDGKYLIYNHRIAAGVDEVTVN